MDLMDIDHDVRQDPNEGVDAEAEQEIAGVEDEEQEEDLPDKTWPTLEEYKRKWQVGLQQHSHATNKRKSFGTQNQKATGDNIHNHKMNIILMVLNIQKIYNHMKKPVLMINK